MTPLRREDIHLLAQKIDNIIDGINSSAKRIAIYNPEKILTDVVELTRIIRQAPAPSTRPRAIYATLPDILKTSAPPPPCCTNWNTGLTMCMKQPL